LATARLIWALAIDIGAVLVALLLIRAAVGIIGASDRIVFVQLVRTLTEPIVWPLAHLPGGGLRLIGLLTPADLGAILLTAFFCLAIIGVIAGWEAEGQR
jgi:hypothetical protein